jgi:hypothetical protein
MMGREEAHAIIPTSVATHAHVGKDRMPSKKRLRSLRLSYDSPTRRLQSALTSSNTNTY